MSAIAGWYTDPSGVQGQLRWWDGARWTDHVTPDPAVVGADLVASDDPPAHDGDEPATEEAPATTAQTAPETEPAAETADAAGVAEQTPAVESASLEPEGNPGPTLQPEAPAEPTVAPGQPTWEHDDTAREAPVADAPVWAGAGAVGAASTASPWGSSAGASAGSGTADPAAGGPSVADSGTPPPPGAPPTPAWGSGRDDAPTWLPGEPKSGSGVRTGLIIAAVVGVLMLAVVGSALVGVFSIAGGGGGFSFEFGETDEFGEFGEGFGNGEVAFGGEVVIGGVSSGQVPNGGSFELDLVIEEPSEVLIDVRGRAGFDATAELIDEFGDSRDYNDDRGSTQRGNAGGGDSLDPLLDVDLEPGSYRIIVRGFGGESGVVEVRVR